MKDRDYMLSDGKKITRLNWRKNLLAFYKRGYRDEMSDARDWYERWRERYYVQEATPRTVWEEKCRGCDSCYEGHCLRWMEKPSEDAKECPRFSPYVE